MNRSIIAMTAVALAALTLTAPAAAQQAPRPITRDVGSSVQNHENSTRCCKGALIGATTGVVLGTVFVAAASEIGSPTADGAYAVLAVGAGSGLVGHLLSSRQKPRAVKPFVGGVVGAVLASGLVHVATDFADTSAGSDFLVLGGFAAGAVIGWLVD